MKKILSCFLFCLILFGLLARVDEILISKPYNRYYTLEKHLEETEKMLEEIKTDTNRIENENQREELLSEINVIEKIHLNLYKCISVYRRCEKELNR